MRGIERRTIAIEEDEDAQDARGGWLEALGGFGIGGFNLPVDTKGDPEHGKETFVEPEHSRTSAESVYQVCEGKVSGNRLS